MCFLMRASSLLPALLLSPAIVAQGVGAPLVEGDVLPTGALVQRILGADVGDDGAWVAWVDSHLADPNDDLLLRDGVVLQREGMTLVEPAGSTLEEIAHFALGPSGHVAQVLELRADWLGTRNGVFLDGELLVLQYDRVWAPELPGGARWASIHRVELDANGAFVQGTLSRGFGQALARVERTGTGLVTHVFVHDGQFLPVLDDTVSRTFRDQLAVNRDGSFVTVLEVGDASLGSFRRVILRDLDTVLAVSGEPSPVAGRRYDTLAVCQVAIDDFGRTAFVAGLDAPEDVIVVVDGSVLARSGDAVPAFASPLELVRGGSLALANSGDVFWVAGDYVTGELAVLRNMDVVVREGVTRVNGRLVEGLELAGDTFRVSPGGRFWVGRARFEGFVEALLTADFGLVVPVPGCHGNPGTLRKAGGDARVGNRLTLEMDAGQTLGAATMLSFSRRPAVPGSECGVLLGGDELLIDPASRLVTIVGSPWSGAALRFDVDVPSSVALVDLELFAQGAFVAPPGSTAQPIVLTNALRIEIGAP
jgi:hypothetical protein